MTTPSNQLCTAKLYRCGMCKSDFHSLSDCVVHMRNHAERPESSTFAALPLTNSVQLQATVLNSLDKKCHPDSPQDVKEPFSRMMNIPPVVTESPLTDSQPHSTLSSSEDHCDTDISSTPLSVVKQECIWVQTDAFGTVSVKRETNASDEQELIKTTDCIATDFQNPTQRKKSPISEPLALQESSEQDESAANSISSLVKQTEETSFSKETGVTAYQRGMRLRSQTSAENERPHACTECPARYRFLSSLSVHKKRHTGIQPYQCKICKKRFWHPTNLRVHERVHTQERPYQCSDCGHGFNQANDLRIHQRIHTGELPLKCPVEDCSRAFRDPACFRRHMNKHAGVLPHIKCDKCKAKFYHPSALARHYRTHTGQKDYVCDACGASFARGDTLKLHKRSHTGQKPYSCSACGLQFADRSYCRRHIVKHREKPDARVISHLREPYVLKLGEQFDVIELNKAEECLPQEVVAVTQLKPDPSLVHWKSATSVFPLQNPDSQASDIPYASVEIEIQESDLMSVEDPKELVYQCGNMLITVSHSVVGSVNKKDSKLSHSSEASIEWLPDGRTVTVPSVPFNNRQTEHQYSRALDSLKMRQRILTHKNNQISDSSEHSTSSLGQMITSSDQVISGSDQVISVTDQVTTSSDQIISVIDQVTTSSEQVTTNSDQEIVSSQQVSTTPLQPLSEYNEIVSSIMESEMQEGVEKHITILSGKQRNPRVGEKRWPCPECDAAFFHQAELKRHRTKHTGELPYQCSVCGKKVRDPSNLKRHIRTHTGERPYRCQVCEKTFSQAGHLTAHIRIHTGQRPFKCNLCPSTFIEANHLRYHQKVHAGIKPFKCPKCNLCFIRNAELRRHMHVHGSERPFQCQLCPANYFRMDAWRQHQLMKHEQKRSFQCPHCSQSFSRQTHLDRHQTNMKHENHSSVKDGDKVTDSKSDTENSVVADALCELAAGHRSASLTGQNSTGASSVDCKEDKELRSPKNTFTNQNPNTFVGSINGHANSSLAHSKKSSNSTCVDNSSLIAENMEIPADVRCDEIFVQRVMVDGGSVTGARMVVLESDQVINMVENVDSSSDLDSTYQTIGEEYIVPNTCSANSFIVDNIAVKQEQPSPHSPFTEPADNSSEHTYIIIRESDQTASHFAQSETAANTHNHGHSVNGTNVSSCMVIGSSSTSAADHQYMQVVPGQPVKGDRVKSPSRPAGLSRSRSTPSVEDLSSEDCNIGSALESTVHSLLNGKAQLESMQPVMKTRRTDGCPEKPVVIKQEPKEEIQLGKKSFIAPLRTRSGRERKVRVKYSA